MPTAPQETIEQLQAQLESKRREIAELEQRIEAEQQRQLETPPDWWPDYSLAWTANIKRQTDWESCSVRYRAFLHDFVNRLRSRFAAEQQGQGEQPDDAAVERELAEAGIDMTEPKKKLRSMTMAYGALAFLKRVRGVQGERGCIVSSADCSHAELVQAQACKRFFVDEDGMGYVHRPGDPGGRVIERAAAPQPAALDVNGVADKAARKIAMTLFLDEPKRMMQLFPANSHSHERYNWTCEHVFERARSIIRAELERQGVTISERETDGHPSNQTR